jgi:hypothetical protein
VLIYQVLEKALEMVTFLHRGSVRIVGGPFTGNTENWRAPCTEHLSLLTHCEGNLEESSIPGDPEVYVEESSGDRHFFP